MAASMNRFWPSSSSSHRRALWTASRSNARSTLKSAIPATDARPAQPQAQRTRMTLRILRTWMLTQRAGMKGTSATPIPAKRCFGILPSSRIRPATGRIPDPSRPTRPQRHENQGALTAVPAAPAAIPRQSLRPNSSRSTSRRSNAATMRAIARCVCASARTQVLASPDSYIQWEEVCRRVVEAHHVDLKSAGGARHAGNLILLCKFHHDILYLLGNPRKPL